MAYVSPVAAATDPELYDAWLAPDGTFYNVYECGHYQFAKRYLLDTGKGAADSGAVSTLENLNWLHISGGWIMGPAARNSERITAAQMDVLMDMARQARAQVETRGGLYYFATEFMHIFTKIMNGTAEEYK